MGNIMFCYPNRADAASLSGGDYEADLPIENAQGRELHKVARTTDAALNNTQLIADLGASSYPIRLLALMAHNISLAGKVRVRGYDTLAVTRASEASYVNEDGEVWTAVDGVLRQWHYVTANDTVRYRTTLLEAARTNLATHPEQFDNAAWTKTTTTVAADSIASPDGFTTADTLTASAGNATVIQNLGVIGSAEHTYSVYLKRKTGSGDIQLTLDGGSTWTTKTITTSWARYSITQTLANPDCGIRIVTNADAIYAWGNQPEAGGFVSSYISSDSYNLVNRKDGTEGYLDLPGANGDYASADNSAALSVTGDIDIRVRVALDDWTPAADETLTAKYTSAGNQRSYRLQVDSTGVLQLMHSVDGTAVITASSTVAPTVSDGNIMWVRVTLDVDDGGGNRVTKFYTGGSGATPTWVQLGSTVTVAGATSIFDGTAVLEVGSILTGGSFPLTGKIYRAIIYEDLTETSLVFDADFSDVSTHAANRLSVTENANSATVTVFSNSAATTRVAETFSEAFTPVPQEMTLYVKFIERGGVQISNAGVCHIGATGAGTDPRFQIFALSGKYTVRHDNSATVPTASAAAAPSFGDMVEIRAILAADGSVTLGQSINGAAEAITSDATTATLSAAWAAQTLYVNSRGSGDTGFNAFIELKIESGTKTMQEMRDEEDPDLFHFGAYDSELIDAYPEFYPAGTKLWGKDVGGLALQQAEYDAGETYPFIHVTAIAQPFRHWSFEVQDTANSDNYVEFGGMFVASAYEATINMRTGGEIGHETDSTRTVSDGGQAFHDAKRQRRVINAVLPKAAEAEAMVQQFALTGILGTDERFFVVWNSEDTHYMQRRAFPATMRELSLLQFPYANLTDLPIAIVEEL